jgi:uncharacterized protein HemY
MKRKLARNIHIAMIAFVLVLFGSCAQKVPGEKALLSYAKASSALDNGEFAQARIEAERLRTANPGFRQAAMLEAKAAWYSGDAKGSAALFRKLGGGKGDSVASLWLARALRSAKDDVGAKKAIETALSSDPDDPRILRLASQIAQDSGDDASSKAYLDRALRTGTEMALAYLDRAKIYWTAGENAKALDDLKAAQSLLPIASSARGLVDNLMETINKSGARKK